MRASPWILGAGLGLVVQGAACAVDVSFTFYQGAAVRAFGGFSYDQSLQGTGVLQYSQLSAFDFTVVLPSGQFHYGLSHVQAGGGYNYLGWDSNTPVGSQGAPNQLTVTSQHVNWSTLGATGLGWVLSPLTGWTVDYAGRMAAAPAMLSPGFFVATGLGAPTAAPFYGGVNIASYAPFAQAPYDRYSFSVVPAPGLAWIAALRIPFARGRRRTVDAHALTRTAPTPPA